MKKLQGFLPWSISLDSFINRAHLCHNVVTDRQSHTRSDLLDAKDVKVLVYLSPLLCTNTICFRWYQNIAVFVAIEIATDCVTSMFTFVNNAQGAVVVGTVMFLVHRMKICTRTSSLTRTVWLHGLCSNVTSSFLSGMPTLTKPSLSSELHQPWFLPVILHSCGRMMRWNYWVGEIKLAAFALDDVRQSVTYWWYTNWNHDLYIMEGWCTNHISYKCRCVIGTCGQFWQFCHLYYTFQKANLN